MPNLNTPLIVANNKYKTNIPTVAVANNGKNPSNSSNHTIKNG